MHGGVRRDGRADRWSVLGACSCLHPPQHTFEVKKYKQILACNVPCLHINRMFFINLCFYWIYSVLLLSYRLNPQTKADFYCIHCTRKVHQSIQVHLYSAGLKRPKATEKRPRLLSKTRPDSRQMEGQRLFSKADRCAQAPRPAHPAKPRAARSGSGPCRQLTWSLAGWTKARGRRAAAPL